jgi:hypothetical protein
MRGYDLADWEPFFTAIVAVAATLTGLLFVAVSINLHHSLGSPGRDRPLRPDPYPAATERCSSSKSNSSSAVRSRADSCRP